MVGGGMHVRAEVVYHDSKGCVVGIESETRSTECSLFFLQSSRSSDQNNARRLLGASVST